MVIVSTLFCYTGYIPEKYYEEIGYFSVGLTVLLFLINMLLVIGNQIKAVVISLKKNMRKWKYRGVKRYRNCRNPSDKMQIELKEEFMQSILVGSDKYKEQKVA